MEKFFDKYAFNARILPVFITFLPVSALVVTFFPSELALMGTLVGVATSMGLPAFLSQLGRDKGKEKEPSLFASWGGMPSNQILSYRHSTFDEHTLERYRTRIASLMGTSLPTRQDETDDFDGAMEVYNSCSNFLREKTRDTSTHNLLFTENINYGFRRNLWGLKAFGLWLSILGTVGCGTILYFDYVASEPIITSLLCTAFCLSLAVTWKFVINESWVRVPAQAYAERLIASVENIDV